MTKPCDLSAVEARRLIGNKKLSPVELLESCIERIEATNGTVNAMVAMDVKAARKAAKDAENAVMRGDDLGLLHGLPVGVKDLNATAGLKTTLGSLIYKDNVPEQDDAMVARVRFEGAVILGKTNTPEFGAGANTTNKVYGATGNPFDPTRTSAGSSGGSAAALAVGQVPLATGSDYGGSLRTPAAFCGVAGFRPSPGLVPGDGRAVSLTPFPVLGPMGRTIEDLHLLLKAQIAIDKADPFSSGDVRDIPERLADIDLGSIRAAFSTDLGCAPIDQAQARLFKSRSAHFRGVFAEDGDLDPPFGDEVHETFEILRGIYFVAAQRERYEKHRDLLCPQVVANVERGLGYSLADVAWANVQQTAIYKRFLAFFNECDVLICPAASVSPFPHSQLYPTEINGAAMPTYLRWLALAYAPTTALACSAVISCGLDGNGLPFGIQIVGPNGSDAMVLEVAHALERHLATIPDCRRPLPDLSRLTAKPATKAARPATRKR